MSDTAHLVSVSAENAAIDHLIQETLRRHAHGQPEPVLPAQDELPANFYEPGSAQKHLKKPDGEPFWRLDIAHDFLEALFRDPRAVFSSPAGPLTFAQLYVRTLAESSKLKAVRDRLKDAEVGIAVGKVCLLVNSGRLSANVSFVPDVRLSRPYHPIPVLQATQPRPLQDTMRAKTLVKPACEIQDGYLLLASLVALPRAEKPNTNPVRLIHLMAGEQDISLASSKLALLDFFLHQLDPLARAQRFLGLVYAYLETDFTPESLASSPFATPLPGVPLSIPGGNADLAAEREYAEKMYRVRRQNLRQQQHSLQQQQLQHHPRSDLDTESDSERKRKRKKTAAPPPVPAPEEPQPLDTPVFPVQLLHLPKLDTNTLAWDHPMTMERRRATAARSRPLVEQAAAALPAQFAEKRARVLAARQRYFQYKKDVVGLADIVYEEIRADMATGAEHHLYQQLGRSLLLDDDELAILPEHEHNHTNERSRHAYSLLCLAPKVPCLRPEQVSFDLVSGCVSFE